MGNKLKVVVIFLHTKLTKYQMEDITNKFCGGNVFAMDSVKNGNIIHTIRYKYNSRKTLSFV